MGIEDLFFQLHDETLIEELRRQRREKETGEALKRATGIQDDDVLRSLVNHHVNPQTVVALAFVPLVEVAWADGEVQPSEREVVLNAMEDCGITRDSVEYASVEGWLNHRPPTEMFATWDLYIHGICNQLSSFERQGVKSAVLESVSRLAQADGGIFGIVRDRASRREKETISRIEAAFSA